MKILFCIIVLFFVGCCENCKTDKKVDRPPVEQKPIDDDDDGYDWRFNHKGEFGLRKKGFHYNWSTDEFEYGF